MPLDGGTGAAEFGSVPFQEQLDFLRQKVDVPSAKWADILGGAHARAFTVAGATKEGMLTDFHASIDRMAADGLTLQDFRKDFDQIVDKYGWAYKGGRNWRTNVIYQTNLNTSYAAGRSAQMTDPDLARIRPYWQYCHVEGETCPRPEHLKWGNANGPGVGLILRHDDPWWSTHYPPNGWGCKCYIKTLSAGDLKKLGKSGPDKAPAEEMRKATVNTSAGPVEIEVPKGIDPGWGYSVGEANQGKRVAEQVMDAWRKDGSKWESLTPNETPPPGPLPVDAPQSQLGATVEDVGALSSLIKRAIGGTEAAIPAPMGDTVLVNAPALADQWAGHLSRSAIAPIVKEAITDPAEIWMSFERHPETGKVVMRQRALKRLALFSRHPGVPVMIQSSAGRLEDFRVLDSDPAAIDRFRVGRLIWKRTEIRS